MARELYPEKNLQIPFFVAKEVGSWTLKVSIALVGFDWTPACRISPFLTFFPPNFQRSQKILQQLVGFDWTPGPACGISPLVFV